MGMGEAPCRCRCRCRYLSQRPEGASGRGLPPRPSRTGPVGGRVRGESTSPGRSPNGSSPPPLSGHPLSLEPERPARAVGGGRLRPRQRPALGSAVPSHRRRQITVRPRPPPFPLPLARRAIGAAKRRHLAMGGSPSWPSTSPADPPRGPEGPDASSANTEATGAPMSERGPKCPRLTPSLRPPPSFCSSSYSPPGQTLPTGERLRLGGQAVDR